MLGVTDSVRDLLISAKNRINENALELVTKGLIPKESYLKNKDQYLHAVYLKYIESYRGSSKKTSIMSYLKSAKNLNAQEELMLGKIKDVSFLIPETLGIVSRDIVLLNLFEGINKVNIVGKYNWVITNSEKIAYPRGTKGTLTLNEAYTELERVKFILETHDKGNTKVFGTENSSENIKDLREDSAILQKSITELETRVIDETIASATGRSDMTSEEKQEFLNNFYGKLPDNKKLGELRNKWVRKEIINDIDAFADAYSLQDKSWIEKLSAPGGILERLNATWKLSHVALNPGSWFRNTVGNFSLLDLSTSTPTFKLTGMLSQELYGALSNKSSKYWGLGHDLGLFGSTWSATELQSIFKEQGHKLKRANDLATARAAHPADSHLPFLDERIHAISETFSGKAAKGIANAHSLLEGVFKVVALRDYLETWEKQNNLKHNDLTDEQKEILYTKASLHAHEAIFDYSKVNKFVKVARKIPLGAPFLTFTYKSAGAAIRSSVKHPMKFAKYALLPTMLTMIAMSANDWDDDDVDTIKRSLSEHQRVNPAMALLPFKDSQGLATVQDLQYVIPWSQWTMATSQIAHESMKTTSGNTALNVSKGTLSAFETLGFLGGPLYKTIAAVTTGIDPFSKRPIMTPGASASHQIMELTHFSQNMVLPSWLGSTGWINDMYDTFVSDKPDKDSFGNLKTTPLQALSGITGLAPQSVSVKQGLKNRAIGFDKDLKDIGQYRSKVIRDVSGKFDKAFELKDLAQREKLIRLEKAKSIHNSTNLK
jgi:hypothetical protein